MRFIFWAFVFFMVGLFALKFITEVTCEDIFFGAWFLISTSLCFKYKGEITIPIGILFLVLLLANLLELVPIILS